MNPQNQKPQANFDFILQQPSASPPKKTSRKKVAVMSTGFLFIITLILVGITVAFKNNLPTSGSLATTTPSTSFVTNMANPNVTLDKDVYPLLGGEIAADKELAIYGLERTRSSVDFKKCQKTSQVDVASGQETVYKCASKSGKPVNIAIIVQKSDSKIVAFKVETNA
ncbi:MAG: hypothetical protein ABIQ89_01585 [Candidatus Saccharimonadales bacterium]